MTRDARALLDHLDLDRAHVAGYSMGASTALALAAMEPRVQRVVAVGVGGATLARRTSPGGTGAGGFGAEGFGVEGFGVEGLGAEMVDGLLAEDPSTVTDPLARQFRTLADSVRADREALAAVFHVPGATTPAWTSRRSACQYWSSQVPTTSSRVTRPSSPYAYRARRPRPCRAITSRRCRTRSSSAPSSAS